MERYDTRIPNKTSNPIDRYKKMDTTCIKDTCLTAQSLALEGLEDYPMSTHLNQWQTRNTNHSTINKKYIKHFLSAKQVVLK
jgi:hypothetical protein